MNKTLAPTFAALPLLFALFGAFPGETNALPSCPFDPLNRCKFPIKKPPSAAENLAQNETTHIKVEFNTVGGTRLEKWYALDAATLRKAAEWQAGQKTTPSAEQFSNWLDLNGGKLDRADGPAVIETYADGTRFEAWWTRGELIEERTVTDFSKIPGVTVLPPQP